MKEKVKKYIEKIGNIDEWFKLLETKKDVIQNVFASLEEKNIELTNNDQMHEIYLGIEFGLTARQIMVYANPNISVHLWEYVRRALQLGIPVEILEPIMKEGFALEKVNNAKRQFFIEKLYS